MRLWHTDLIHVLPRQQLLGQWRELNSIFKKQDKHLLINFVYDYTKDHLYTYSLLIIKELEKRKYNINKLNFYRYFSCDFFDIINRPFPDKMTDKYLVECYFNLMEKHDCGGMTDEEWEKIDNVARERVKKCVLNNL